MRVVERACVVAALAASLVFTLGCSGIFSSLSSSGDGTTSPIGVSSKRLYNLGLAARLYVSDYDDVAPLANWADGIDPYLVEKSSFNSPVVPGGFGYAMNRDMVGRNVLTISQDSTVLFFDSTVLARSAVASLTSMPVPARYGSQNTRVYVDGRVDPEYVPPDLSTPLFISLNNLKRLGTANLIYAADYDEHFPQATWTEALFPYVRTTSVFRDPSLGPSDYGYAFNRDVVGHATMDDSVPAITPVIFDSTVNAKDAVAPLSTLPTPGRYNGLNAAAFADGHAAKVTAKTKVAFLNAGLR